MRIAVGCDPNAMDLKNNIIQMCREMQYEVIDFGSEDPIYANTGIAVAQYVASGNADRGILACGTGLGMSIAANKVKGAYAALLSDVYSAKRAVKSNNSNIACLGAFTLGRKLAEELVRTWLSVEFEKGSSSQEKVDQYVTYDMKRG